MSQAHQRDLFGLPPDTVTLEPPARPPSPVRVEKARLNRLARQMLAYMLERKGQWIANHILWAPDVGGNKATSQRKRELIADGWQIEKRHAEGSVYEYRLVGMKNQ